MSEPFVSNVLSYKYDTALDFHVTMYDHLPYQRDSDYCNIEKVMLVSGRVIKFYLCFNQPEAFAINNKDDEIEDILAKVQIAEKKHASTKRVKKSTITEDSDDSQDKIHTLLDDDSNEVFDDDDDLAAPADSVNAFADVEDW